MTGRGHRIVTFVVVGGTTASLPAAVFSFLSSTLPDSLEYALYGKKRNRYHRKFTHWFLFWLALSLFCFSRAGWTVPRLSALISGVGAERDLWGCAAFWLMGFVMHGLEDACCGKVPFLVPWRRTFGAHLFRMSPKIGEMSTGEKTFTWAAAALSLVFLLLQDGVLSSMALFTQGAKQGFTHYAVTFLDFLRGLLLKII